jgi:hypothetical protein
MQDGRDLVYQENDYTMKNENILPVLPLFGFDNSDELEQDLAYIKQLYPNDVLAVQREIESELDKLEYDGSPMYHAYPDKVYFESIAGHIYAKLAKPEGGTEVEVAATNLRHGHRHCCGPHLGGFCRGRFCGFDDFGGFNPWLRNTVNVLLLNDVLNRRRRYRSYKRLF